MIIEITGRHVSISEALREHARSRLEQVLKRTDDVVSAHVILDVEKTRQMAEMIVHGRNLTATVHAESEDLHLSVDRAAEKLRHQLERHASKRKERRRRGHSHEANAEAELAAMEEAREQLGTEGEQPATATAASAAAPAIRRRVLEAIRTLSVAEATRELDTHEDGVFVYRDAASSRLTVLFRRGDGELGAIETGAA